MPKDQTDQKHWIYTIRHPDQRLPFYVGITATLSRRIAEHIREGRIRRHPQVVAMLDEDTLPVFEIIGTANSRTNAELMEIQFWDDCATHNEPLAQPRPRAPSRSRD